MTRLEGAASVTATGSGSLLTALVTKIRCPQTIGLECASPAIGVRHRMLAPVSTSHVSGRCIPSATPDAAAPRNDGQLPVLPPGSGSGIRR